MFVEKLRNRVKALAQERLGRHEYRRHGHSSSSSSQHGSSNHHHHHQQQQPPHRERWLRMHQHQRQRYYAVQVVLEAFTFPDTFATKAAATAISTATAAQRTAAPYLQAQATSESAASEFDGFSTPPPPAAAAPEPTPALAPASADMVVMPGTILRCHRSHHMARLRTRQHAHVNVNETVAPPRSWGSSE